MIFAFLLGSLAFHERISNITYAAVAIVLLILGL